MRIQIKTKNFSLTAFLKKFVEEKINSLEKIIKPFQAAGKGKPEVSAQVEIEKTTLHHKKGDVFRAEANLTLFGEVLRAEAESDDLKTSVNQMRTELQREIGKTKEKIKDITERKERVAKKEMRLSSEARFWRRGRIKDEGL